MSADTTNQTCPSNKGQGADPFEFTLECSFCDEPDHPDGWIGTPACLACAKKYRESAPAEELAVIDSR